MRLEPVFVVSPRPVPPTMPTRRAFLLASGTFAIGSALGAACGYSLAARAPEPAELESSGDAELDELRRLAVKAPIEELVERRLVFLNSFSTDYRKDLVLCRGIERLCDEVASSSKFPDRRVSAKLLTQWIENADPEVRQRLISRVEQMRSIH